MSRRLSQLGPGVAWTDLDADGDDDLLIGSGAGGSLAVYRNNGAGGFQTWTNSTFGGRVQRDQTTILGWSPAAGESRVLIGSAHYEDGLGQGAAVTEHDPVRGGVRPILEVDDSSAGALALADLEGDGDLDLFLGGRVVPGRYPEPASSRILRQQAGEWRLDAVNTERLRQVGLVNGATWSDLDGDGLPELLLACEWGPIRIFGNRGGVLHESTDGLGYGGLAGLVVGNRHRRF